MEDTTDFSQFAPVKQAPKSVTTEAMISRQAQEVQAAMVVAKRFPRDEFTAFNKIMTACERKSLAESAIYSFPRGATKITGPSIRLAEVLALNWGNIDFGIMELEQKNGESTVMSYAWDLETNTRRQMLFTVKHERKAGGTIKKLDDPRDIYEMVANNGARRLRACILAIIPGDIVDAAEEKCKHTLTTGNSKPLVDRVRDAIVKFDKEYSVSIKMLEDYIGCNVEAFTEQDYLKLGGVIKALRDGMAKRDDYFDIRPTATNVVSKTATEFEDLNKSFEEAEAKKNGTQQGELSLD